LESEIAVIC